MSYTIYVRQRPIATALVIDTTAFPEGGWRCDALVDGIVASAIQNWGERNNPIVLIEPDKDLSKEEWIDLESSDPDRVQAFTPLSDDWVKRFDTRLNPWSISVDPQTSSEKRSSGSVEAMWSWLNVSLPGVNTPPRTETMKRYRRPPLLMIEFAPECPLDVRRFFHRNFGTFTQWSDGVVAKIRRVGWLEGALSTLESHIVRIADVSSACAAIHQFAGCFLAKKCARPLQFVAPVEISSFGLNDGNARHVYQDTYRVFVGDTLRDFTACWNELRQCRAWGIPHHNAIWIPTVLAESSTFLEAIAALVFHLSGQHSSGSRSVEVTSETLRPTELDRICTAFRSAKPQCQARAIDPVARRSRLHEEFLEARTQLTCARLESTNAERFRMSEQRETFILAEPAIGIVGGSWAVDVQVDRGETSRLQTNRSWYLPRRSGTLLAQRIFRTTARVTREHLFAVSIGQTIGSLRWKPPELRIELSEESRVVGQLILARPSAFAFDDVRKTQTVPNHAVVKTKVSDKGQNLRGLIQNFGGFLNAEDFCRRLFWRDALETLAGHDARRSKVLVDRLTNAVRKGLRGDSSKDAVAARAAHITARLLPLVQGALEDAALSRAEFKHLLDKTNGETSGRKDVQYLSGDAQVNVHGVTPVSEEEMHQGLNQLLANNVLRAGILSRCSRCGIESWLHIDEIRQFNHCPGCGNSRPVTVEAEWRYRLNPLVKQCVSARTLAVLHSLICVAEKSLDSFFYSPNLELYRSDRTSAWRELDVVCVTDGELLIGEVKDGDFDELDLGRFADAAESICPDRAALFTPLHRFNAKTKRLFAQLHTRLEKAGIKAEIYQLPLI